MMPWCEGHGYISSTLYLQSEIEHSVGCGQSSQYIFLWWWIINLLIGDFAACVFSIPNGSEKLNFNLKKMPTLVLVILLRFYFLPNLFVKFYLLSKAHLFHGTFSCHIPVHMSLLQTQMFQHWTSEYLISSVSQSGTCLLFSLRVLSTILQLVGTQ